jgi:hypothetical protein
MAMARAGPNPGRIPAAVSCADSVFAVAEATGLRNRPYEAKWWGTLVVNFKAMEGVRSMGLPHAADLSDLERHVGQGTRWRYLYPA